MSKIRSNSSLPGFRAAASLDEAKIHYQISGKSDLVRNRSIIPQLRPSGSGLRDCACCIATDSYSCCASCVQSILDLF